MPDVDAPEMTPEQAADLQAMLGGSAPSLMPAPAQSIIDPVAANLPPPPVQAPDNPPVSANAPPTAMPVAPTPVSASDIPHHNDVAAQVAPTIKPVTIGGVTLSPFLSWTFHAESGGDPNARPTDPRTGKLLSSAGGYFQITDPTFQTLLEKHPELRGLTKNDPPVAMALEADNNKFLTKALGHPPNLMEQKAAWFFGASGAVSFLHALDQDPHTTVDHVLSPQAINANRAVLLDQNGNPRSVADVYNIAARSLTASGGPAMAQRNPGSYDTASNAPVAPPSGAAPGASPFSGQQSAIDAYIKGQPAMWNQLEQMRQDYLKAREVPQSHQLQDMLYQYSLMHAAANAKMNTSAGSIATNSLPSSTEFQNALQAQHAVTEAQRARTLDNAKDAYGTGTQQVIAQNEQGLKNLGLTGDLTKTMVKSGQDDRQLNIEQQNADTQRQQVNQSMQIELLKYGQSQSAAFEKMLGEMVPAGNPDARNEILRRFLLIGSPSDSSESNLRKLTAVTTSYLQNPGAAPAGAPTAPAAPSAPGQGGAPASAPAGAPAPAQAGQAPNIPARGDPRYPGVPGVSPPGVPPPPNTLTPQESSGLEIRILDPVTQRYAFYPVPKGPAGMQFQQAVLAAYPDATPINGNLPAAASQTVNVNGGGGGGGGGGGDHPSSPVQEFKQHQATQTAAEAALQLLPILAANGSTSSLTDSEEGKKLLQVIKQTFHIDPLKVEIRQLVGKLVQQVANSSVMSNMSGIRGGQRTMGWLLGGTVPANADPEALGIFLRDAVAHSKYEQDMISNRVDLADAASKDRTIPFNPTKADFDFIRKRGGPPSFMTQQDFERLTGGQSSQAGQTGQQTGPNGEPIVTNAAGKRAYKTTTGWVAVP